MSCREPSSKPKPWSTGRILTEEQRRRKREVNRLSQRRRKNKIAQRVEHLETQLSNLLDSSASPSPTNTVFEIMSTAPTLKAEQVLRNSVPSVSCRQQSPPPRHQISGSLHPPSPLSRIQQLPPYYQMKIHDNYIDSCLHLTLPVTPPVAAAFAKSRTSARSEIITTFCQHLNKSIAALPNTIICSNDLQNQNMLVRAVLYGWSVTETLPRLCPLWTILQHVDTSLFRETPAIERFVLLRHIHMMMLYKTGALGPKQLPLWYRYRPAQLLYEHHPSIDYLGWPGLRERLVLSSALRMTDQFWAIFGSCFRFEWPYTINACYETDAATGMLRYSPLFDVESLNIDSCRMTSQFFDAFPEMADDIRTASSEPLQIFGIDDHESVDNMGFGGICGRVSEQTQLVSPNCSTFGADAMSPFVVGPT
ncbi:hypothetical protein ONS95_002229 [Cadophora gregata]|uniref:uncharacterized protein n=1 Tax=Cadophora gregata TaxID=51156 RepID=UPI0026DC3984|nr:uncharacterized protein ONS95_002229 [Cadophora gregata]KAK0109541.1 hypothetical protein ONS95_002229 [Cadophora gregata]KAK0110832.1 hypothetical protein ONS96_002422 [Cadophora gregata f. sp. sojae]